MSKRFTEASQGPVLDQNSLVPEIQILTGFLVSTLCCLFRIGTFPDLRLDLLKGQLKTILAPLQSGVAGGRSLSKAKRGDILLAWYSNSLRIGRGTLAIDLGLPLCR